jgi:hypothetical protein
MADPKELTQADIDKAVNAAVEKMQKSLDALEAKNSELLDEAKKAKAELRKVKEISPEDVAAIEAERDKALVDLAAANKAAKEATAAAEKATKALEAEQGAARSYALDAEINKAIAEGNVVPALVPAFSAMVRGQAKADLVDGKYAVTIADKPAAEYISTYLNGEEGKAFKAAPMNSGGGGSGGGSGSGGGKQVTRAAFDAMGQVERVSFAKEGGKVVDA